MSCTDSVPFKSLFQTFFLQLEATISVWHYNQKKTPKKKSQYNQKERTVNSVKTQFPNGRRVWSTKLF